MSFSRFSERTGRTRMGSVWTGGLALLAILLLPLTTSVHAQRMSHQEMIERFAKLPDWSGMWFGEGGATPLDANRPRGTNRNFPPYKPAWEAAYSEFVKKVVETDEYIDPLTLGYGRGMPGMMAPARAMQFVVRPEQVWIMHERPDLRFIYTDGRDHPEPDLLIPTMEGHSIGHWEGDTLVVHTVGIQPGIPADRTGMAFSAEMQITERMRLINPNTLEVHFTIEDPIAFTKPWIIVRRYHRQLDSSKALYMANVNSLENQRNPIVDGSNSISLGVDLDATPSVFPAEIRPRAVMPTPK